MGTLANLNGLNMHFNMYVKFSFSVKMSHKISNNNIFENNCLVFKLFHFIEFYFPEMLFYISAVKRVCVYVFK